MPRPGWDVVMQDAPVPPSIPTDTGVAFMVGVTAKGPESPQLVRSLSGYEAMFGGRSGGVALFDAVDAYFREGGSRLYVSAAPTTETPARYTPWGTAFALPGEEPAEVEEVATTAMTRPELNELAAKVGVKDPDKLGDKEAVVRAIQAAQQAQDAAAKEPRENGNGDIIDALDRIPDALGPGQVLAPGISDQDVHLALLAHASSHNRIALLDAPANATAAALASAASGLRSAVQDPKMARFGALVAPRAIIPGVAPRTTRFGAWSAIAAGIIARSDALNRNANVAAAGTNGTSVYSLALEQQFTDDEYETLNDAGVIMAQYRWGQIQTYGYVTLVDRQVDELWWWLGNSRLAMQIRAEAGAIAERYVFSQLDGRFQRISEFGGDLRAMLVPFYELGALYGETAQDAFQVEVGPGVNTPETIAAGELHAVIQLRMSPGSEYVEITIVKVATTQSLAAVA